MSGDVWFITPGPMTVFFFNKYIRQRQIYKIITLLTMLQYVSDHPEYRDMHRLVTNADRPTPNKELVYFRIFFVLHASLSQ